MRRSCSRRRTYYSTTFRQGPTRRPQDTRLCLGLLSKVTPTLSRQNGPKHLTPSLKLKENTLDYNRELKSCWTKTCLLSECVSFFCFLSLPQDGWSQIYTPRFEAATFYCSGWWWRSRHEVAVMWCGVVSSTAITVYVSDRAPMQNCTALHSSLATYSHTCACSVECWCWLVWPERYKCPGFSVFLCVFPCFMFAAAQQSIKIKQQSEGCDHGQKGRGWKTEIQSAAFLLARVWPAGVQPWCLSGKTMCDATANVLAALI